MTGQLAVNRSKYTAAVAPPSLPLGYAPVHQDPDGSTCEGSLLWEEFSHRLFGGERLSGKLVFRTWTCVRVFPVCALFLGGWRTQLTCVFRYMRNRCNVAPGGSTAPTRRRPCKIHIAITTPFCSTRAKRISHRALLPPLRRIYCMSRRADDGTYVASSRRTSMLWLKLIHRKCSISH